MSARVYSALCSDELGAALRELAGLEVGTREVAPNWGPAISRYLASVGIRRPAAWCAAFLSDRIRAAEVLNGIDGPTDPTAVAKVFRDQLRAEKRWLTRAALVRRVERGELGVLPGWIVVWDRGTPAAPWRGHVGVVDEASGDAFVSVEGNAGPRFDEVARVGHTIHEPRLLGAGVLSGPMP